MSRIAQEEIDHIKRSVSVAELVRTAGVELRGHGENLIGRCKWHEDSTPSLVVTPAKNLWHCMGACQTGGDAYAWTMKDRGVTFPEAHAILEVLAPALPPPASPLRAGMSDEELMRAVVGYYAEKGKQRSDFQAYLVKRGIDSAEMIDRFSIGYAPANPSLVLPHLSNRETELLRGRLQTLGVFRAPRAIEHLAGSLVVPVFDAEGSVAGMYGRKIRDDLRTGTAYHLYLPGPHRGTGGNTSPALVWSNVPAGTKSLALQVHDPDAPTGSGFWHWAVYDIAPTVTGLAQGAGNSPTTLPAGAYGGNTDFMDTGATGGNGNYGGPCPPQGDKPHRYVFTLYAIGVPQVAAAGGIPKTGSAGVYSFVLNKGIGAGLLGKASFTASYGR